MGYFWQSAKETIFTSPDSGNIAFLKAIDAPKDSLFQLPGNSATNTKRASGMLEIAALPGLADEALPDRSGYAASSDNIRYNIIRNGSMTACVITYLDAGRTFLAFDYSTPGDDWKVNFDAHNHHLPTGGRVHDGYFNEMFSIHESGKPMYEVIQSTLAEHAHNIRDKGGNPHLSVTGYSKGGAQALMFGSLASSDGKLKESGIVIDEIITFGQPAIGNDRFAELTAKRFNEEKVQYTRFINDRDIVPQSIFYNRHFGNLVYLSYDGYAFENPSSDFVRYKKLFERRGADDLREQVRDHYVESYRSAFTTASAHTYVYGDAMADLDKRASLNLQSIIAWAKSPPLRPDPPEMPLLAADTPTPNIPNLQSTTVQQVS